MPTPLRSPKLLVLAALTTSMGALHCSGATTSGTPAPTQDAAVHEDATPVPVTATDAGVPTNHIPTPVGCSSTRPPGVTLDAGAGVDASASAIASGMAACTLDSQCTDGKNGRCLEIGRDYIDYKCTYDACTTDSDCPSMTTCNCDPGGNDCLPGNCRSDGDCGQGGYCSPSYSSSCGSYNGLEGYYCHTANDDCTNDSQCGSNNAGSYCYYSTMVGKWTCSMGGVCSG